MLMVWLEKIDQEIVLAINGWNHPFLDEVMWFISQPLSMIPMYVFLLYFIQRNHTPKFALQFFLMAVITIFIVDQLSVHAFKEVFERYRPSHHTELREKLHLHTAANGEIYYGGKYGFVSSHAANVMALFTLVFPLFYTKQKWIIFLMLFVVLTVMYSRIYLGVHYLSDILAGAFLGFFIAFLVNKFIFSKWKSL